MLWAVPLKVSFYSKGISNTYHVTTACLHWQMFPTSETLLPTFRNIVFLLFLETEFDFGMFTW